MGNTYRVDASNSSLLFAFCNNLKVLNLPQEAIAFHPLAFYGLDKSEIIIYVNHAKDQTTGYTAENGYAGFKDIIFKDASNVGVSDNEELTAYVDRESRLRVLGVEPGTIITVYSSTGKRIATDLVEKLDLKLESGIYVVKAGSRSIKVVGL